MCRVYPKYTFLCFRYLIEISVPSVFSVFLTLETTAISTFSPLTSRLKKNLCYMGIFWYGCNFSSIARSLEVKTLRKVSVKWSNYFAVSQGWQLKVHTDHQRKREYEEGEARRDERECKWVESSNKRGKTVYIIKIGMGRQRYFQRRHNWRLVCVPSPWYIPSPIRFLGLTSVLGSFRH